MAIEKAKVVIKVQPSDPKKKSGSGIQPGKIILKPRSSKK